MLQLKNQLCDYKPHGAHNLVHILTSTLYDEIRSPVLYLGLPPPSLEMLSALSGYFLSENKPRNITLHGPVPLMHTLLSSPTEGVAPTHMSNAQAYDTASARDKYVLFCPPTYWCCHCSTPLSQSVLYASLKEPSPHPLRCSFHQTRRDEASNNSAATPRSPREGARDPLQPPSSPLPQNAFLRAPATAPATPSSLPHPRESEAASPRPSTPRTPAGSACSSQTLPTVSARGSTTSSPRRSARSSA